MVHDISQLPSGLREGDIVSGKYRIDGIIGAGAMGIVVVACHLLLDEKVAIKFLLPEALGNSDATSRFLREAQAAVRIKSEHIARVLDVATLEDGTPYIVMEYLEGSDLAAILQQRGALSVEQAVEFVLQACEAIAEAHELGIVHRDLKPANLFVVRRADGVYSVKVLDFGISKTIGDASGPNIKITDTMVVMGSPAYMSPEQMESARKVDLQTDVWALGAILCELVTGRIPFDGQSLPEVYTKIVSQPQPAIREWSPGLPVGLEDVILKCLKTNRKLRYRDVGDLAAAVSEFGPRRAAASVERIARTLEASKKAAANGDPFTGAPWSPRQELSAASLAEKTLCSWGDPVPATLPSPKPVLTRTRVLLGAGGGLLLVAIASTVVAVTRTHAVDPTAAAPHASGPPSTRAPLASSSPQGPLPTAAEVPEAAPPSVIGGSSRANEAAPIVTKPRSAAAPEPTPPQARPPTHPVSGSPGVSPLATAAAAPSSSQPPAAPSDLRALDLGDPK